MDIRKLQSPKVTIGNMVAILVLAFAGVGWAMSQAEDMATIKAQVPAIQAAQAVEAAHNKERHEDNKERLKQIEVDMRETLRLLRRTGP